MSDHDKKNEGELHLRLLAITEDPTFQGNRRTDNKSLIGGMIIIDDEERQQGEASCKESLH